MVIDLHSHILPGVDDGSADVAQSLQMLQREAEQGIGHVIATPHFYANHNKPEEFLSKREAAMQALQEAMAKEPSLPKLSVGAEVHFFSDMSESSLLPQLTIGDKGAILVEMPPAPWPEAVYRELKDIYQKQGLLPIVAHIDRYGSLLRIREAARRLEELPVLVQANASFFLDCFTAPTALRLLKEDRIHLLGSDCHNLTNRAPNLGKAVQKILRKLGQETIDRINRYENLVLSGNFEELA